MTSTKYINKCVCVSTFQHYNAVQNEGFTEGPYIQFLGYRRCWYAITALDNMTHHTKLTLMHTIKRLFELISKVHRIRINWYLKGQISMLMETGQYRIQNIVHIGFAFNIKCHFRWQRWYARGWDHLWFIKWGNGSLLSFYTSKPRKAITLTKTSTCFSLSVVISPSIWWHKFL